MLGEGELKIWMMKNGLQLTAGVDIVTDSLFKFLEFNLGISRDKALGFYIMKYLTRLNFGDDPNHKKIEEEIMTKHLETLTIIETPNLPERFVNSGVIDELLGIMDRE